MIHALLAMPLSLRLAGLFVIGVLAGTQINRGIYRLAWNPRDIGPWSRPAKNAPPRKWCDRLPILGWYFLRREAELHGRLFWLRPLFIELLCGVGLAWYYYWLISGGQYDSLLQFNIRSDPFAELVHAQFLVQSLLIGLMVVATFIDFDEKTIPDEITLPGVLLGLALAALLPASRLPVAQFEIEGATYSVNTLQIASPTTWPAWLDGPGGLAIGLCCLWGWCYAIGPRLWTTRGGLVQALKYHLAHILRRPGWRYIAAIGVIASFIISGVWWLAGEDHWRSLLSSLAGMAFSGGLIWAVRIVGSKALGMEAMGFGDVTLMAMIGAFLGWQPSLLVFFLAPFAALIIAVIQLILTRKHDIAFGPYLSLGALLLLLNWVPIWEERARMVFSLGWWIPLLVGFCLILMGGMLAVWRRIKEALFGPLE